MSSKHAKTDPRQPHLFQETNDPGLGAVASGSVFRSGSQVNILAATTGYLRATRCAMAGCGKPREDPIHARDEE